jgi:hypothetical protein
MTSRDSGATKDFGGWGSPPRPRRRQARRRMLVVTLAGLLGAGTAAAVSFAVTGSGTARPNLSKRVAAEVPSAETVVDSISAIVATSAADRARVISAIDQVQNCSLNAGSGRSILESVINDRRTSVTELERMAAGRPPAVSAVMLDDLVTTLNAAISDDESYMSWMGDIAGGRASCGADPMSDPNFAAAKAESDRTNLDKQAFVDAWNPLAARYGKPAYQAGDF